MDPTASALVVTGPPGPQHEQVWDAFTDLGEQMVLSGFNNVAV